MLISYFLLLNTAQAQEFDVSVVATILGIPAEYAKMPEFLYFVTLPFICVFAVLFGLLTELRLFRRAYKINFVISFAMTFMLLRFGILLFLINTLYAISAAFAAIVFAVLFIVGTGLWAYGRGREFYSEYYEAWKIKTQQYQNEIEQAKNWMNEAESKAPYAGRDGEVVLSEMRSAWGRLGILQNQLIQCWKELEAAKSSGNTWVWGTVNRRVREIENEMNKQIKILSNGKVKIEQLFRTYERLGK